nr:tripartite tricarboxylate transporter substrate-binding protein [Hydrogenophaga sp. BPS33]
MLARRPILALALTLLAGAMPAFANTFPTQPVRFIVPFPPGGSADALTRMLAQRMQAAWGQAVVVENKPGGTVIGTDLVAKAAPDGHTIALVIPSLAVNPSIMAQLPYDTVKDLAGVTLISTLPIALFATPSLPVNNVAELVAYAKKNPKTLSYGSARLGSTSHLAGLMLNQLAGVDLVHVPYKGSAPAQQDLIGGRLTLLFDSFISQLPMVQAGRVKLVAPAGPRAAPRFPRRRPDRGHGEGIQRGKLLRGHRATGNAARGVGPDPPGHQESDGRPRRVFLDGDPGHGAGRIHAGAVRRVHPGRHEKVGGGRQVTRRQDRVSSASSTPIAAKSSSRGAPA